jgi:DNA polymerase-3 subunit alpha
MKANFPTQYMTAILIAESGDIDKVPPVIHECGRMGVKVLPPDINESFKSFAMIPKDETHEVEHIRFGLNGIKNLGEHIAEVIYRERKEHGAYKNLEDLLSRIHDRDLNKKSIESLVKCGAMDGFGYNRNEILSGFSRFVDRSEGQRKDREVGQTSLFDLDAESASNNHVQLDRMEDWGRPLSLAYEKEVLGFYLTDHPLQGLEVLGKVHGAVAVSKLVEAQPKSKVHVLALISGYREIITKKGTRMAFARLEDTSGGVELVVFPDTFAQTERVLKSDAPLMVSGILEKSEGAVKVIAEQIRLADELFRLVKKITVKIDPSMDQKLALLRQWADKNPGDVPLVLQLTLPELQKSVELNIKEAGSVRASMEALDGLNRIGLTLGFN